MEKIVRISKLSEFDNDDIEYWLTRDPAERLEALQMLREFGWYDFYNDPDESRKRLRRVYRITQHASG